MNKQEIIDYLNGQTEWSGNHHYILVNRSELISMIEDMDELEFKNYLRDIKSQIDYLRIQGPGKGKSLRMLENMVDNMLTGYWSPTGEKPREASWQDAIQFLEDHFGCEIPRNLDQVIEGFKSMSGLMNTVEFELDKQGSNLTSKEFVLEALERYKQKVKVPAFVAEWFEENKHNLNFAIYELCEAGKVPVDLYEGLTDFERWFYLNHDIDTLIRMLDGYEIEEEPKWKIINDQKYCLTSIEAGYGNSLHWAFDSTKKKPILFDNEETALYTAYITGGTVEKV